MSFADPPERVEVLPTKYFITYELKTTRYMRPVGTRVRGRHAKGRASNYGGKRGQSSCVGTTRQGPAVTLGDPQTAALTRVLGGGCPKLCAMFPVSLREALAYG